MKIEEMTVKELRKSMTTEEELKHLRARCIQVHGFMGLTGKDTVGQLSRRDLMTKYTMLREEMAKRGMTIARKSELDEEIDPRIFRKSLYKFDIDGLRDYVLVEKYVSLSGDFVKTPKDAADIDVVIRTPFTKRDKKSEILITEVIKSETGKPVNVKCMPGGPTDTYLSIYDLVLRARGPLSRVVKKVAAMADLILPMKSIEAALQKAVRDQHDGWMCDHSETEVIYEGSYEKAAGQLFAVGYMFNKSTNEVTLTGKPEKVKRVVTYEREGAGPVLKSEEEPLEKIETTENYHRIPVRGKVKGHGIVTIDISPEKGIKALEDTDDKEIVTYLFDVDKWTLEEAKTWANEHKSKAAFMTIRKADKVKQIIGGLVYEPGVKDTQGESTTEEEIEKAMYAFMQKYADDNKRIKIMHKGESKAFPILECFQAEVDTKKGGESLRKGAWWVTIKVNDETVWKDIEEEKLTGFSMGGTARAAK